jgi:hypothetical protein
MPGSRVWYAAWPLIAIVVTLGGPRTGAAQGGRTAPRERVACDRTSAAWFEFGTTGGNIRPDTSRIAADGTISRFTGGRWVVDSHHLSLDAIAGAARLAATNGFMRLPAAPTRPTRNPDASRSFITLHSPCGSKHVEVPPGTAPPSFRELLAVLERLNRPA